MGFLSKKTFESLKAEAENSSLNKIFNGRTLIMLGVGMIIGAGLFSTTGYAAAEFAGPGIIISFLLASIGCAFAGLCYAEFASMIPVSGSAYTYSYATMGEFVAWVIGWDLVLEYAVGASAVSSSWSSYIIRFMDSFGVDIPKYLMMTPFDTYTLADGSVHSGIINLPALILVVMMSLLLMKGTKGSSWVNNIIVIIKVAIVLIFIFIGFQYVNIEENLTPLIPENKGNFGEFGWSGVIRAAALVFFAYSGFDAVTTVAQETKNPEKNMPIGLIGSLIVCTVLYMLFSFVMMGVVNYQDLKGASTIDSLAPVAIAIENMGEMVNGVIEPAYPWLNRLIIIAIFVGFGSVVLVDLMAQSRVFHGMSKDGLLPKYFSKIDEKTKTPRRINILFMIVVGLFGAFIPGRVIGEMTSIGVLFAFILVCIGILVMRKTHPEIPRSFKVPLVPLVPILGVLSCLGMMVFLPVDTWIRLVIWMMIGLDIYLYRGITGSVLGRNESKEEQNKSYVKVSLIGMALVALLLVLAFIVKYIVMVGEEAGDGNTLFLISVAVSVFHIIYYCIYYRKGKR